MADALAILVCILAIVGVCAIVVKIDKLSNS